jgi:hexosaminidase
MPVPVLLPPPTFLARTSTQLVLTEHTRLSAPPAIAELVRQLLCGPTGLNLDDAAGPGAVLAFDLVEDPSLGAEGYHLRIDDNGLRAVAAGEAGLRWAVQTIRQLLPAEAYSRTPVTGVPWVLPGVDILDVPRLPWRGALLDVARWYQPVEFLFEFVDLLAMHKLNILHLHLTDDQGWRFETRKYPRLTDVGGWRSESTAGHLREGRFDGCPHGGFYTQDQLRDLVEYAGSRGVRIMPEIDLPGHMQAAICAYPQLGNAPRRQIPVCTAWGVSQHVLNTDDGTLAFMRDVLDEVVDVFPFEYVHLGGDEVLPDEWSLSPRAQQRVRHAGLAGVEELLGWWIAQMGAHLRTHGRNVAGWDELVEARPPRDTLIFAWRDAERVRAALAAGHAVVAVPQEYLYLDRPEDESLQEPLSIGGLLPLSEVYGYQPVPTDGDERVLGMQGMLWGEYLPNPSLVQWRAFPRLVAIATTAWSGRRDEADFAGFLARLPAHLRRLDNLGVTYRPLG